MTSVSGTSSGLVFNKECMKKCIVVVCKELFSLLCSVKQLTLVTTMEEVLEALRNYIFQKKLFHSENPSLINCKNDKLGSIFGRSEFSINDIKKLLQKLVLPLPCDVSCDSAGGISSFIDKGSKRSAEFIFDTVAKRICLSHPQSNIPMFLHIPNSPIRTESASDTAESVQGYETSFVKDTSDDSFWLDDDRGGESDGSFILKNGDKMLTIAESYEVEYEVETDCSTDFEVSSCSDSDSEEALEDTIITFVCCKTDSDQEFFADASSDEEDFTFDAEITDKWTCKNCGQCNKPPMRYCLKCWQTRRGWLATENNRIPQNPKRRQKLKRVQGKDCTEKQVSSSHDSKFFDLPSTSEEGLSLSLCVEKSFTELPFQKTGHGFSDPKSDEKLCLICCSKPVNSSIVHGKYAHSISCYGCALKLRKRNQGCPICRRTIERVVHQISVA